MEGVIFDYISQLSQNSKETFLENLKDPNNASNLKREVMKDFVTQLNEMIRKDININITDLVNPNNLK